MSKRSEKFSQRKKDESVPGVITAVHGGDIYSIELEGGKVIKAHRAGRMKLNKINVLLGDKVRVLVDPYGGNATSRITYRV